jgi:hypothetical protein
MSKTKTGSNATFTGSQKGLTTVGDYCYAYNEVGTDDLQSIANTLEFTTGKYIIIGHWTVCGSVNKDGDSGTGAIDQFYLKLNNTTVMSLKTDTGEEDSPQSMVVPIVIPPLTKVECSAVCGINNENWLVSNTITGRIYG